MKVTITIEEYFDLRLTGGLSYVVIDKQFAGELQKQTDFTSYCHLEPFTNNNRLFQLWPLKEWRASNERLKLVKAVSEAERTARRSRQDAIEHALSRLINGGHYTETQARRILDDINNGLMPKLKQALGL